MIHRIPDRHFFTVKNRLEEAVKRNVENLARHKQTHTHVHTRIRTYYIPKKKKEKRKGKEKDRGRNGCKNTFQLLRRIWRLTFAERELI